MSEKQLMQDYSVAPHESGSGLIVAKSNAYHEYGKEHPHAYTGLGYNVLNNAGEMAYGPDTPPEIPEDAQTTEQPTATPETQTPEAAATPTAAPNIDPNVLVGALMQALTGRRAEQQAEAQKYKWAGGEPTRYDTVKSTGSDEKEVTRVGMLYAIPRAEIVWAENPYMGNKQNREAIVWGVDNSVTPAKEYTYYVQNNTVYNLEAFRDGRSEWVDFNQHGDEAEQEIPSFTIGGEPWKLLGHMPAITVTAVEVSAGSADEYDTLTDKMLEGFKSRGKDPFDQAHDLVRGLLEEEEAERRANGGATPPRGSHLRLVINEEDLTPAQPATPAPRPATPPAPAEPVIVRRRPRTPTPEPKGLRARAKKVMNGIRATGARAMRTLRPWAQ